MSHPDETQDPRHRRPSRGGDDLHPSARGELTPQGARAVDDDDFGDADLLDELASLEGDLDDDALPNPFDATLRDDMHIADDDDDLIDDESGDLIADARSRLTVEEVLRRLREEPAGLDLHDLFVLSDLSRSEMAQVERELPLAPVDVRRRLVRELTSSSEEFIELELGRLLRVALHDEDPTVRRLAVEGLWEETEADLIGPLTSLLASDGDESVRAAAAAALGAYVLAGELDELDSSLTMRAEQALLAVLQTPTEAIRIQARALESLAYSSEAGLRQLIEDAYYAPEEEMRVSSLRAMGRSADSRWRSMARQELSSPDAAMRAEAARACGELEDKGALQEVIDLIGDESLEVRLAAIEALGHLGGKQAREALRSVSGDGDETEAAAAEIALEEMILFEDAPDVALFDDDDEDELDDDPDSDGETPWSRPPSGKGG